MDQGVQVTLTEVISSRRAFWNLLAHAGKDHSPPRGPRNQKVHEGACEYLFGKATRDLNRDNDVASLCAIYVSIFENLRAKWTNPQIAAALGDLTTSCRVYSNPASVEPHFVSNHLSQRDATLRYLNRRLFMLH